MLRIKPFFVVVALFAIASLLAAKGALAQHDHGDVEFSYELGKITIEFGDEGRVFEGNFSDLAGGLHETDDPGFDGYNLSPGDILGFNVRGPLLFHNGVSFAPTTAIITLDGVVGPNVLVSSSNSSGLGVIGQVDGDGLLHAHIDYLINSDAPAGAYGVLISLTALDGTLNPLTSIADSDSFYLVLNRGLDEEAFEGAVGVFAAQVPEPNSMAIAGLALVFAARFRGKFCRTSLNI